MYTEEKERLMSQLQEETEEYVKAAFAEKDCQLRELNEDWQTKYDQLTEEVCIRCTDYLINISLNSRYLSIYIYIVTESRNRLPN